MWSCGHHIMWCQLSTTFSNATEVAQWGTPSCNRPQSDTDNGVRDGRSNWLVASVHPHGSALWAPRIARCKCELQIPRLAAATGARTSVHGYARPTHLPVRQLDQLGFIIIKNKCYEWMKYGNVLPNHKNANMGSSTVHIHGVHLIGMQILDCL